MKEVRVLQIIDSLNAGGAEVLAINIANHLANLGMESHLCVTRVEGDLFSMVSNSVNYLFLGKKKTFDFAAFKKLRRYIAQHKINIIHAQSTSYFVGSCMKILFPKIKLVWHDHFGNSEFLTHKSRYPVRFMSFLFHSVVVVNEKLLTWNQKYLSAKNFYLLNNFAEFMNSESHTQLKGTKGKRIVHVASFIEQKDHLNLLKAFKEVQEHEQDWTLHLIGKGFQDDYYQAVEDYIANNKLSNSVFIYGVCTDVKNILSQSTIGVLSSKSEGLPVSLLEFGLAKLPVVVTNVGNCSILLEDKDVVVEPENSMEFSQALLMLIKDQEKRDQIAQQLHNKVIEEYSIDSFVQKLLKIYSY